MPECVQVVQLVQDPATQQEVARRFGVSQSVISRVISRHQQTGLYSSRPGTGPRSTISREDRHLDSLVNRQPFQIARRVQQEFHNTTNTHLRVQTIMNRLHDADQQHAQF